MHHISRLVFVTTTALPAALLCGTRAEAAVTQRWSFNSPAGAAADETEIINGAGGEAAVIRGAGAAFTGTGVSLPGGSSATEAYVDLPNSIVSTLNTVTIEGWVTIRAGGNSWSRIFDFGSGNQGEIFGPGTAANGNNYLFLSAATGGDYNTQQLEFRVDDATNTAFRPDRPAAFGQQIYFAVTLDNSSSGATIVNYWRNGEHLTVDEEFPYDLNQLIDENNWLGRSNWTADANLNAEYNEFRIHDAVLTPEQIKASRLSGPDDLLADADADGMPDGWEKLNGLDITVNDAALDLDNDGSPNSREYAQETLANNPDTDGDGLPDGVETGTGVWNSATNTGTDPLNPDSDRDGLRDSVETKTGVFVNAGDTGTDPNNRDSDGDFHGDGSEVASGSDPTLAASIPVPRLVQRYSFSETGGGRVADAAGGAPVSILGSGHSLAGGSLTLNGGDPRTAAYAALPAGVLSNHGLAKGGRGAVSVEGWATVNSTTGAWARLVDFGSSNPGGAQGAIFAPGDWNGGGSNGLDYLLISAYTGNNAAERRVELRNDEPLPTVEILENVVPASALGGQVHFVLTYDESSGRLVYYENGAELVAADTDPLQPIRLSDLNDVNNWLGRSNFTTDANLDGSFNEFRIYDNVLPADTVAAHFAAGPDAAPAPAAAPDADADGMADWFERAYGFNPADPADAALDADNDGLSNRDESLRGSNPRMADTDSDGLSDGAETNTGVFVSATDTGTSPFAYDSDGDYVSDSAEVTAGSSPLDPASTPAQLIHRWRFNNPAGDAADGATSADEIGGAQNAVVRGEGAVFTGTGVQIPGGGSATQAYIDLPNNLISPLSQTTIEGWVSIQDNLNPWARIFDFGDTAGREIPGPGEGGNGGDYLFLSATVDGTNYTVNRLEMRNETGGPATVNAVYDTGGLPQDPDPAELIHFVVTVDSTVAGGSRLTVWRNGVPTVQHRTAPVKLSELNDVNNWLGRSNWLADANLAATYQDFRIYNGILDIAAVARNFADGPEAAPPVSGGFEITAVALVAPGTVRLTWQTVAGSTYTVQSSPDLQQPWTNVGDPIVAAGATATADAPVPAATPRLFYRILKQN